jgi:hypothetical protein
MPTAMRGGAYRDIDGDQIGGCQRLGFEHLRQIEALRPQPARFSHAAGSQPERLAAEFWG